MGMFSEPELRQPRVSEKVLLCRMLEHAVYKQKTIYTLPAPDFVTAYEQKAFTSNDLSLRSLVLIAIWRLDPLTSPTSVSAQQVQQHRTKEPKYAGWMEKECPNSDRVLGPSCANSLSLWLPPLSNVESDSTI
ncbi:hypothetical protein NQZ68_041857 [Dissostichus eleginoides]|nr:hypothetical protein NQZ68_041857 [Dissostichus eleginoides]